MTPIQRLLFVLFLTVGPGLGLCRGQEDFHPQVTVVHPGPDALIKDLKSVFDLTPANAPYWLDVKDLLENMALGVDPERSIRIDVLTGLSPVNYTFWVPFDEFDFLRESMDSLAYETIPEAGANGLYRIVELDDIGWLREIDEGRYAAMILTTPETGESLKLFIQTLKNPGSDLQALIDRKAGLAVRIANRLQDSEAIKKRSCIAGKDDGRRS